jgi:hypothetical protein
MCGNPSEERTSGRDLFPDQVLISHKHLVFKKNQLDRPDIFLCVIQVWIFWVLVHANRQRKVEVPVGFRSILCIGESPSNNGAGEFHRGGFV